MNETVKLTPKQDRFIDEYLVDLNATQAYKRASPKSSYETCKTEGNQYLTKPHIRDIISQRLKGSREMLEVTREKVLREYKLIAFSDIFDFITQEGSEINMLPIDELKREKRRVVKEIKTTKTYNEKSDSTETTTTLKLYDKLRALDILSKYVKLIEVQEASDSKIEFVSRDGLNG